jgi:hypothetical protein
LLEYGRLNSEILSGHSDGTRAIKFEPESRTWKWMARKCEFARQVSKVKLAASINTGGASSPRLPFSRDIDPSYVLMVLKRVEDRAQLIL